MIIGSVIQSIYRVDYESDYEFLLPMSICLELENTLLHLKPSKKNHSISIDTYKSLIDFKTNSNIDFNSYCLNNLKLNDCLLKLREDKIQTIQVAQYKNEDGPNFTLNLRNFAGVIIQTENHRLLYYNNGRPFVTIDLLDVIDIPNPSRWTLKDWIWD